jgi:hypothetical protein
MPKYLSRIGVQVKKLYCHELTVEADSPKDAVFLLREHFARKAGANPESGELEEIDISVYLDEIESRMEEADSEFEVTVPEKEHLPNA